MRLDMTAMQRLLPLAVVGRTFAKRHQADIQPVGRRRHQGQQYVEKLPEIRRCPTSGRERPIFPPLADSNRPEAEVARSREQTFGPRQRRHRLPNSPPQHASPKAVSSNLPLVAHQPCVEIQQISEHVLHPLVLGLWIQRSDYGARRMMRVCTPDRTEHIEVRKQSCADGGGRKAERHEKRKEVLLLHAVVVLDLFVVFRENLFCHFREFMWSIVSTKCFMDREAIC